MWMYLVYTFEIARRHLLRENILCYNLIFSLLRASCGRVLGHMRIQQTVRLVKIITRDQGELNLKTLSLLQYIHLSVQP
jgi:hypothetical protein